MADGKVTITIDLDGKNAQAGIKQLKGMLGGLGDGADKTGGLFKNMLGANVVSSALMSGLGALQGTVSGLYGELSSNAKAWKTFEGNLTQVWGASDKTKAKINEVRDTLQKYAAKTIYSASDMAQTYSQLAAVGIENTDKLVMGFGGLAAAAENPTQAMKTLSQQATQMAAKPTVQWMDFKLMLEQTPAGIAAVAKQMGMSTSEMVKAVQDGKISTQDFFDAISAVGTNDTFSKMATEFKTIDQAVDGLKENVANNLAPVFEVFNKAGIKAIESLTNSLNELDFGKVASMAQNAIDKVGEFFNKFKETGALSAAGKAFGDIGRAISNVLKALSGGKGDWTDFGTTLGDVVVKISELISGIAQFTSSLPSGAIKAIVGGLVGLVAGFKALNFLKSFNPFNLFSKNASSVSGATSVVKSASTSIVSIIRSLGKSIAVTARGIGKGIGDVFRGIGQGLALVNPATIAALAVPILALGAAFAIMGMQGQGITTILQGVGSVIVSVGTAIGTILNQAIQGLAQGLVIVAPVLPTITSAFAQLSPLITAAGEAVSMVIGAFSSLSPVITALGTAIAQVISALSSGIAEIITAATPIVEILGNVFTTLAQIVADAIVQVIQALAPFIPSITQMVQAVAPVLQSMVEAFNNLISQVSPIIDSLTQLFKTFGEQVSSILESAGGVVESFGSAIRSVLDGVAGIFDSIGNAALNAGKGFKLLADGVVKITNTNLGDMAASLTAVAAGVGAIAAQAGGLAKAGTGMKNLGTGMQAVSSSAMMAVTGLTVFVTRISILSKTVGTLPSMMTTAASGFANFTAQAVSGVAGLSAINTPISIFKSQLMTITPSLMMAGAGFASFGSKAMVVSAAFAAVGGLIIAFNARVMTISATMTMASNSFSMLSSRVTVIGTALVSVSSGFTRVSSSATNASSQVRNMATSTQSVISAFNAMRGQVQSSMQAILSVIRSVGSQMMSQGCQIGQQTAQNLAQGIRGGIGQSQGAMQTLMSAVRFVGMSGVGSMRGIGAMIGQGLAQGMYSALGAVTAAANALIAQAERAAKAKAQIHSPSRLFRDSVGRFLPMGVAVGVEKNTKYVDKAIDGMYEHINAFNFKAEDVIGVGKTKLSKVIQVKSDLENAIKATVEVAKEKSNNLIEKALEVAEKAVDRPAEMILDDGTLVAKTGGKYATYHAEQTRRENRMKGIIT